MSQGFGRQDVSATHLTMTVTESTSSRKWLTAALWVFNR